MVHKHQETAILYEAQAQNTDKIMSAKTGTMDNDMDNRYVPRINHNNCPCRKPTYNNLSLNTVSH